MVGSLAVLSLEYVAEPSVVVDAVVRVAKKIGWNIVSRTEGGIVVRVGMSIRSWGEEITIQVAPRKAGGSRLKAESKIRIGWWDWGKNDANLARFSQMLDAQVARVRH